MIEDVSRQLPAYALYPTLAVLLVAVLAAMARVKPASGKFLLFIVWLRYAMQSLHDITYQPSIGGASLNAIVSLGVCGMGFIVIFPRLRLMWQFPFLCGMILVVILSGLANNMPIAMIETLLKWSYFVIIMLCVFDCASRERSGNIFSALIWAVSVPIVLQILSVILGVAKAGEADGSVSYIGGFNHEAAFSITLITAFAVTAFAPKLHPLVRIALLAYAIFGIFLANYRTTLLALAPMALGYLVFSVVRPFKPRDRLLISAGALLLAFGAGAGGAWMMQDRLADIAIAADSSGELIKPPNEFSETERRLMSGRLYIWNRYYDDYLAGTDVQHILGKGPDSWADVFGVYAHNTLVSNLYEYGIIGALLVVLIWGSMLARAFSIGDGWLRGQIVTAHLGFIVLNFATMPFWQIEGLILYGLLCGYTLFHTSARAPEAAPVRHPRFARRAAIERAAPR